MLRALSAQQINARMLSALKPGDYLRYISDSLGRHALKKSTVRGGKQRQAEDDSALKVLIDELPDIDDRYIAFSQLLEVNGTRASQTPCR